jgi:hypothetical protein
VVDTDRIDDTFRFFDHTSESADKFASVAEDAKALNFPRTIESWREEVPDGVGRPRGRVWRKAGSAGATK